MKTKLHKLKVSVVIILFSITTMQSQYGEWTKNAKYKLKVPDVDLYMTIDLSTATNLVWAAGLPGDDEKQVWTITDHRDPDAAAEIFMEITATVGGVTYTMATDAVATDGKNLTLIAREGLPVTGTGDLTGLDQFQRRKTGTEDVGNDALFLKVPWTGGSRYGIIPTAAGDLVKFDGGGIDKLEFVFVEDLPTANVNDFDLSAFFMPNPVNDELTIQGLPSNVKQVAVYSLLGQKLLSKEVNSEALNVNVSALKAGMYIVDFSGENGRFAKKIIKK